MRLVGYDLQQAAAGIQLQLFWQAMAPMDTRYKLFVHLVGDGGPADIRAQADVRPSLPTTAWIAGEYLSDVVAVGLPGDLPPGRYTLLMGVYDEGTGERLPAMDARRAWAGDYLVLDAAEWQP
jgi:hypothetical protein